MRPAVLVYTFGFGTRVSLIALLSAWIDDSAKAQFFAAVGVLETVGHGFGDPAIQQVFAAVVGRKDWLLGLPFFVAGVSDISP